MKCEFCGNSGKKITIGYSKKIILSLQGEYLQIKTEENNFEELRHGILENIKVNYCPMCGKKLSKDE